MQKGFTLVEMIIVIGIFGVLLVAGTDFLIAVFQNTHKVTIDNEVRQNANNIMQNLETSIRNAACISWVFHQTAGYPVVDGMGHINQGTGDITLTTYIDNCVTAVDTYDFLFDPSVASKLHSGRVFKTTAGVKRQLSSTTVAAVSCSQASLCGTGWGDCKNGFSLVGIDKLTNIDTLSGSTKGSLTVDLVVQATTSATRVEYCASSHLSETITPRSQF